MKVYIKSAFDSKKLTKQVNDARTSHLFNLLDKQSKLEEADYNNSVRNYNRQMQSQLIAKIEKSVDRKLSKLNKEINAVISDTYSDTKRQEIFSSRSFRENFLGNVKDKLKSYRDLQSTYYITIKDDYLKFKPSYSGGILYLYVYTGDLAIRIDKDELRETINREIKYENTPDTYIMSKVSEGIDYLGSAIEYALECCIEKYAPDLH